MNITKKFGIRLKELRTSKNLTQAQLAEMVGLDVMSISRIESGARFPQKENICKLSKVLECDIKELFDFEHNKTKADLLSDIDKKLNEAKLNDLKYISRMINIYFESK
nr:MAG TPA: helix-turn-helix domain protein [Caudoviricetes sp.]